MIAGGTKFDRLTVQSAAAVVIAIVLGVLLPTLLIAATLKLKVVDAVNPVLVKEIAV